MKWENVIQGIMIGMGVGAWLMIMFQLFFFPHAAKDHTHEPVRTPTSLND